MSNGYIPSPLEHLIASTSSGGDAARSIHDAIIHLERIYHITSDHSCTHDDCIIPEFRRCVGPLVDFMREQRFTSLPGAPVYLDLGMEIAPDPEAHGIPDDVDIDFDALFRDIGDDSVGS